MTEIVLNKSKIKKGKDAVILDTIVVVVITLFCMFCILPFIMLIATSFETETNIVRDGYKLWPSTFTTQAYETVIKTAVPQTPPTPPTKREGDAKGVRWRS
ncbi:hypothetical protein CG709_01360, partial [Lachnotalea glycerini]